jgi:hypothetical protein
MTDVVERVMQLVRLAVDKGATSEEGRSAAAKACDLIARHKLRIVDGAARAAPPPPPPDVRFVDIEGDIMEILQDMLRRQAGPPRRPRPVHTSPPQSTNFRDGWEWCKPLPRAVGCMDCGAYLVTYDGGFVKPGIGALCGGCALRRGVV